jgi:hypothetical protein
MGITLHLGSFQPPGRRVISFSRLLIGVKILRILIDTPRDSPLHVTGWQMASSTSRMQPTAARQNAFAE